MVLLYDYGGCSVDMWVTVHVECKTSLVVAGSVVANKRSLLKLTSGGTNNMISRFTGAHGNNIWFEGAHSSSPVTDRGCEVLETTEHSH